MPFRISPNVKPNAAEPESSRNRINKGRVKGMWTIVFVLLITLVVVFLFWTIISLKKDSQKDSVTFTCSVCG